MTKLRPIVITGSIAIDRIMRFKGSYSDYIKPDSLSSLSISIFLDKLSLSYGGVGANIAYTLSLLGAKPVLLGAIGKDGSEYKLRLKKNGVDVSYIHESKLPTASFNVFTDNKQNQIGGFYPGAMFDSKSLSLEPWKNDNPIIMISPHDPIAMRKQISECRKWNLAYCYDIGQQVSNTSAEDLLFGLESTELLVLNEYELALLCDKTGLSTAAIKNRVPIVITTLGEKGSIIDNNDHGPSINVNAVAVSHVKDPTGAGDAYRAGLLYGLSNGWDLKICGQLGSICAAYAVENDGTQNHKFKLIEFAERYELNFNKRLIFN